MRALTPLIVILALIAGVVFVADRAVTATAEQRVAERVGDVLGAPAEVDLHGWPLTLRTLATGTVPRVDIRATGVPVDGATIDRLDIALSNVEVDLDSMDGGADSLPAAEEARFTAYVGEASLEAMLRLPEGVLGLSLADGTVRFEVGGTALVDAEIRAAEGMVVIETDHPLAVLAGLARIDIDLAAQPGRPYVEGVEITPGGLVARGRLEEIPARTR